MERQGPREWSPRRPESVQDLESWLRGAVVVAGEGQVNLGDRGPVYVALVHDGSGFNPRAVVVVDQNPYHDLSDDVLSTAFEIIEDEAMKNKSHVKEIQEEWGERWEEILTEGFDGKVWTFHNPYHAAAALKTDPRTMKFIEINQPEPDPEPKMAGARMGAAEGWVVTQDGETLKSGFRNEAEAWEWLQKRHKQGVDHAVRFESYDVALIRDGHVVASLRRKLLEQHPPPRDLETDISHREFWQLDHLDWWEAMAAIRRKVGPERFRAWMIQETKPWVGRVKVIEELAWNDRNSEWSLNFEEIVKTRMLDEDTPASPETVTDSLEQMIASSM